MSVYIYSVVNFYEYWNIMKYNLSDYRVRKDFAYMSMDAYSRSVSEEFHGKG